MIDPREPIAIIGLGGVFPKAPDIPAFWSNILSGVDCITEVPSERWDWRVYYDPDPKAPDKTYSKIGAFAMDFKFDPLKLRIPTPVAHQMDPVQQMAVAATAEALKDSGYDAKPFDRERTAVVLGNAMGGTKKEATDFRVYSLSIEGALCAAPEFQKLPDKIRKALLEATIGKVRSEIFPITEDSMPGELSNVITGRIANVFNLNGPNFTVDAACASTLAALDQAVKGLRFHEYDMAVCGGADQMMSPPSYVKFCKIGALSPDGSRPFDARANGFVMGEGAGILILKRFSDALKDGDRIYALIRAVGASSDGKGKGITAPNPKGQKLAVERCFSQLEYTPGEVGLLEAHGTATQVGDVVETGVANEVFGPHVQKRQSVGLGSVKSQIGHLKAASAAAGLIKAALAIYHKKLPPSINFKTPNPGIDFPNSPFRVITRAEEWDTKRTRRANVSSFGFGGANLHVALEEFTSKTSYVPDLSLIAPQGPMVRSDLAPALCGEAVVVGGSTPEEVLGRLDTVRSSLPREGPLGGFVYDLSRESQSHPYRLAVAAESGAKLREKIDFTLATARSFSPKALWDKAPLAFKTKGIYPAASKPRPKVAFLFPGQGSQYVNMLKDLVEKYPVVAGTFAEADEVMKDFIGKKLSDLVFTKGGETPEQLQAMEEALKQTEITQPAVLTADIAILRLLAQFGVQPDVVCGHSLGEYGALVASGIFSFRDALIAVSARAKEMAGVKVPDTGKMASIAAPCEKVDAVLKGIKGYVVSANKNCPSQTVIAGESRAVEEAIKEFQGLGVQAQVIRVSHAFHSKILQPGQAPYRKFLEGLKLESPKVPILSNVTADYYPSSTAKITDLLVQQIASPVEFIRQTERMLKDGVTLFIEIGPKRVLTAFVSNTLETAEKAGSASSSAIKGIALSSNHPKRGGILEFNDLLARLEAEGIRLKWPAAQGLSPFTGEPAASGRMGTVPSPAPVSSDLERYDINLDPIVVTGIGAGTPGSWDRVFRDSSIDQILSGQNLIEKLSEEDQKRQLDKNIVRLIKSPTGDHELRRLRDIADVVKLAGLRGAFDIEKEFGLTEGFAHALDISFKLAIAAGILALRDAGIPLVRTYRKTTTGGFIPTGWALPEEMQDETGVIFGAAFPAIDSLVDEVSRHLADKYSGRPLRELENLYTSLLERLSDTKDRVALTDWYTRHFREHMAESGGRDPYTFSRDFLLRVLSMGHTQMAQWIGARGPAVHINAACASTTQAVGIAEDWIRLGRCKRVLVIAGDDVTSPTLREWMVTGFLTAGAATPHDVVSEAALPFDRRRNGMIMGMGAVGMVVEDAPSAARRGLRPLAELLAAEYANSAFHATRLEIHHVAQVMERLVRKVEKRHGLRREAIAEKLLFVSHETYTPARGGSAQAEVEALQRTFGSNIGKIVVANTKGFHGHSMGASIEDVVAIRALNTGRVPPIANYKEPDPDLAGINLSRGGEYDLEYALRLGAGFGSQIAMTLVRRMLKKGEPRIADPVRHRQWLVSISGQPNPELEVVCNTLRVKEAPGVPGAAPRVPERPKQAPMPAPVSFRSEPAGGTAAPRAPSLGPSVEPPRIVPPMTQAPPSRSAGRATPTGWTESQVSDILIQLVSEKTGYPPEMLELDLDMEADLGIDTVKQAELFGIIREKFSLPRREGLAVKNYPTLRHVLRFVLESSGGSAASAAPAPAAPAPSIPLPGERGRGGGPSLSEEQVRQAVVQVVSEKTGYPPEMLELDLDMEADLGIDTVKQAELFGIIREKFSIERREGLSLKDYPTLRHVIRFVLEGMGRPPQAASVAPAIPAPRPSPAPASAGQGFSEEGVRSTVVQLVGEKTGYPAEMLELDLDMEADLGIDTVKQAELFGIIREKFAISRQEGIALKDYPTLRHVIGFVLQATGAPSSPRTAAPTVQPMGAIQAGSPAASGGMGIIQARSPAAGRAAAPSPATDIEAPFKRYRVVASPKELSKGQGTPWKLSKQPVLVVGGKTTAKGFVGKLKELGIPAVLAGAKDVTSAIEKSQKKAGKFQGLVFLNGLELQAKFPPTSSESFEESYRESARLLFETAKRLAPDLSGASPGWVLVATAMDGCHGYREGTASHPLQGALTGLAKALSKEFPASRVKAVDFDRITAKSADLALSEILEGDDRVEVGFVGGKRHVLYIQESPNPAPKRVPGRGDVFLITGGAMNLGAELSKEIARRYKAKIAIIDIVQLPPEAEKWAAMGPAELEGLKSQIWQRLKSENKQATPVMLEGEFAKVVRAAGVFNLLKTLRSLGSQAEYVPCDLTNLKQVEKAVDQIVKKFSKVDVLCHAAGMEKSKLIVDKPVEIFDLVFRVKVVGLANLLACLPKSKGRIHLFFTSVSGRFGNIGQTDYSSANDFLAKTAQWLRFRGTPAAATDLTAIASIGMSTRGGVKDFLESQGVEFMPPEVVMRKLLRELEAGAPDPEVVLAGKLGKLAEGFFAPSPFPFLGDAPQPEPGREFVVSKEFSLESDPYLNDHRVGGTPYVPGVVGLEIFSELASRVAGRRVTGLKDIRFALPIKLLRDRPIQVRAVAARGGESAASPSTSVPRSGTRLEGAISRLRIESDFISPQGIVMGGPRSHFAASALEGVQPDFVGARPKLPKPGSWAVTRQEIYQAYFHGPRFQVLKGITEITDTSLTSICEIPATGLLGPERDRTLLFVPLFIESAFQTCGYRDLHRERRMTLPDSIERVVVSTGVPERGAYYVHVLFKGKDEAGRSVYDGWVFDDHHKVWVEMRGYKMIAV